MKKAEKEERVADLWAEYRELGKRRREKEKEAKGLKSEEMAIEGELGALVPEGDSLGGVFHKTFVKRSVRYSEAFDAVIERLVPKTKREKAEEVKSEFTSENVQHRFEGVK